MSFVDTLRQWDEAITCADRQDLSGALRIFMSIQEPNSKISFDIGCLHFLHGDLDAAEKAFDCSIRKDEHLAVAFFQRGTTFYRKQKYEESLADFHRAFRALRGNQLIDYKPLGLRYILYACEILHNVALVEARLGNWERAQENLVKALDCKTESKLSLIDRALQSTLKQKLFQLVAFPSTFLFRPNKHYVAELEKKDYLGKAKVVASVIPQDDFSGFAPLQPQAEDGPASPREPEVLRVLEGEPHTVLFEFCPETSDELAVVPGNIVFVLQKGADNWAYVVFNERRGLVPYNYLERLEISLASQQNQINQAGRADPPSRDPPTRPERIQGLTPGDSRGDGRRTDPVDTSYIIKVRFTFNFAVSLPRGSPYGALLERISKKLNVPAAAVILSSEAGGQCLVHINMENLWSRAKDGRLTVWCKTREVSEEEAGRSPEMSHLKQPTDEDQDEIHLVALHSYHSSNPEDLNFDQGETIKLLSRVNQDWLEGCCSGNTGIFPASFVKEVPGI